MAMAAEDSFLFHALDFLHKVGNTLLERQLFVKELFTQLLFLLQVLVGLGDSTLVDAKSLGLALVVFLNSRDLLVFAF